MIKIEYHRSRHELTAKGHAGYAPEGQDIVCAAVSALMLTAASFAQANGEAEICLEPGDLRVRCLPRRRYDAPVSLVFNAIAAGLRRTAAEYPENVEMEVYA